MKGGAQNEAAAPLHQEEPDEVTQVPGWDAFWMLHW